MFGCLNIYSNGSLLMRLVQEVNHCVRRIHRCLVIIVSIHSQFESGFTGNL